MQSLDITLLADGPSDAVLLPILKWAVQQHRPDWIVQGEWADLRQLPRPPRSFAERIVEVAQLYRCQVLFVHRDAEKQDPGARYQEIHAAIAEAKTHGFDLPHICVVPVRMTEAWLLLDAQAIRWASGNPNSPARIELPTMQRIETLSDPKKTLHDLLKQTSGLTGRRLKRFRPEEAARQITERINDFSALRSLPAFCRLEDDIKNFATKLKQPLLA